VTSAVPPPYTLVAELTYRCPLRCAYCSNPTSPGSTTRAGAPRAMAEADWLSVLDEAAALGVLQVHFTGGEPLLVDALEALVTRAAALGLYTNLITSAVPLTRERLARLRDAGLEHIQISFQSAQRAESTAVAGVDALDAKRSACAWARELGLALTVNVVLHRQNLDGIEGIIELARSVHADRLELAHVQLLGWAMAHRDALLPTSSQIEHARRVTRKARARLGDAMEIVAVLPDHHADLPRACMDGWGLRTVVVAPDGLALPCHAARDLPLTFDDVRARSLATIWAEGSAFRAFRGEGWMPEPCRSCDRRADDHGGCRCRAFALTGDPAATDPACPRAPAHHLVASAVALADAGAAPAPLQLRRLPLLC
jgi:pyrroloquinoline quinone biosynthesis protein E